MTFEEIRRQFGNAFTSIDSFNTQAEGTSLTESNLTEQAQSFRRQWEANQRQIEQQRRINQQGIYMAPSTILTSQLESMANIAFGGRNSYPEWVISMINQQTDSYDPHQVHSIENLTDKQRWILQQLQKGKGSGLVGIQISIICNERGQEVSRLWKGKLISITGEAGGLNDLRFTVAINDGSMYEGKLYQIEPIKNVKPIKPNKKEFEAIKRAKELQVVENALKLYNINANSGLSSLKGEIEGLKRDKSRYEVSIKDIEARLKKTGDRLSSLEETQLDIKGLDKLVSQIKKHAGVEDAYITPKGRLFVITKTLYAHDEEDKENKNFPIGRFVLKMSLTASEIWGINLDYALVNHPGHETTLFHPNISGSQLCWGDNAKEVRSCAQAGQLYELVDFLIIFFSTYPHDPNSNPFIGFDAWQKYRKQIDLTDDNVSSYFTGIMESPLIGESKAYNAIMRAYVKAKASLKPPTGNEIRCPICNEPGHEINRHLQTGMPNLEIQPEAPIINEETVSPEDLANDYDEDEEDEDDE